MQVIFGMWYTASWRLVSMVAPNIYGASVWSCLHVTILAPRILRWLLGFWKICARFSWFIVHRITRIGIPNASTTISLCTLLLIVLFWTSEISLDLDSVGNVR